MPQLYKYRARDDPDIVISEQNGVRSLHLGGSMVQSAMKLAAPNDLALTYTQCMMSFLLFHPCPVHILMIGLGGGSLAKFVYHKMPKTKTTIIEINPQIVATAYNYFALPAEDERFKLVLGEGSKYIANHPLSADILMIDGFDNDCQVPSLCNQSFYRQAHSALNKNGILVVNLLSRDKDIGKYLKCIEETFNDHVVAMLSEVRGNLIVLALKHGPAKLAWKTLKTRAKTLEKEYSLPFYKFVSKLRQYNLHNDNYLEI